jgi:hypothetical protein
MTARFSKEVLFTTTKGDVRIHSFCSPQKIRQYTFDGQFQNHEHYKSLYTRRQSLEDNAGCSDANVVLAVTETENIISFGLPDMALCWNCPPNDENAARASAY